MRYTIYEDPVTHRFAFLPLPGRFAAGDELPVADPERWFVSHADAIAALAQLLDREENQPGAGLSELPQATDASLLTTRHH